MIDISSSTTTPALPETPSKFIKIINHPHSTSGASDPIIIPLDGTLGNNLHALISLPRIEEKPWAPFRTWADFEYTETAVLGLLSKDIVNKQLFSNSLITLRSYTDMEQSLEAARAYGVPVRS